MNIINYRKNLQVSLQLESIWWVYTYVFKSGPLLLASLSCARKKSVASRILFIVTHVEHGNRVFTGISLGAFNHIKSF